MEVGGLTVCQSLFSGLQIRVQHWGGGGSPYFGDFFDIGGMILKFLFLMTFFFARQAFFSPFFVKIQLLGGGGWRSNIGGMYPPSPPGFAALLVLAMNITFAIPVIHYAIFSGTSANT